MMSEAARHRMGRSLRCGLTRAAWSALICIVVAQALVILTALFVVAYSMNVKLELHTQELGMIRASVRHYDERREASAATAFAVENLQQRVKHLEDRRRN